ncbi:hypothetical protein HU200_032046 [Digitaria exilis]|uniref:Uncharacterized protein n=1 Tax=Digitaria exilis TaxID=1010633 RepID=A0A835BK67_9POAL|nr:hypothetical protein HU200_032046 [Digitaria exilis]
MSEGLDRPIAARMCSLRSSLSVPRSRRFKRPN